MSILGAGAGAAEGLDTYLAREMAQQKLDEEKRQNLSEEALKGRQIDQAGVTGQSEAELRAAQSAKARADVAEVERQREVRAKIITDAATPKPEKDFVAADDAGVKLPYELITEPNGPPHNTPAGSIEKDAGGFLHRIGVDNSDTPIKGADGQPFRGYQAPEAPQLGQNDDGFFLIRRTGPNAGQATPVNGPDGEQLHGKSPASAGAQTANRATASSAVDRLSEDIDQADKAGLLGPASGRLYESLATLGSTGDKAKDSLIGRIKGDLLLTKMHVDAGIGGSRAASSPLLLQRWEDLALKSSPELLKGYLSGIRDDVAPPKKSSGAAASDNDPLGLGLTKKP